MYLGQQHRGSTGEQSVLFCPEQGLLLEAHVFAELAEMLLTCDSLLRSAWREPDVMAWGVRRGNREIARRRTSR